MPATKHLSKPVILDLPWTSPPLRSNDRRHWTAQHRAKADAKHVARLVAANVQRKHGTITEPVTATIVWTVTDRRRRDAGASSPTLKVCLDAAVEVGLLVDDRHELVVAETCRIEHGTTAGVRIELEAA